MDRKADFQELKRLFDEEVKHMQKTFLKAKSPLIFDDGDTDRLATGYVMAGLLDGYSIFKAESSLDSAKSVIKEMQKISTDCIQSSLSSFLSSLSEGD